MQKKQPSDWLRIMNSALLVALLPLMCSTLRYTKGIYDKVNEVVILKESDHAEWLQTKIELTRSIAEDASQHSDLQRKCSELNAGLTTCYSDISVLEMNVNNILSKLKMNHKP